MYFSLETKIENMIKYDIREIYRIVLISVQFFKRQKNELKKVNVRIFR
jgi:hypothetical protein